MKKALYRKMAVAVCAALALSGTAMAADAPKVQSAAETIEEAMSRPVKVVNFDNMLLTEKLPAAESVTGETVDINLVKAVTTAIQNNRDIKISEYQYEQAEAAVGEAAASLNPTLDYSFKAQRTNTEYRQTKIKTFANQFGNQLGVNWVLWTGGQVEGLIDAARYQRDAAEKAVYLQEAQTKLDAMTAYFQFLEAINLSDVAKESVDNLQGHLTNVQQQYNAGIVAKLDVLSSNVSLANAKQSAITAENSRDVAEANLNNIMRIPMATKLIPDDTNFPEPDFTITMEQALAMAEVNRWEIARAEDAYKAAKEQVRVAKAGYLPSVSVGAGYSWGDDEFPGVDATKGWNVSGGLSWSLWDGGATNSKVQSAKAAMKEAEETLAQAKESVALEVRQDYLAVLAAKEKIRATEAAVEEAEEAFKIATVRYKSGVGINLDVLDAQLNLNSARTNYITAMYDYNVGLATLEKAIGIPAVIREEK